MRKVRETEKDEERVRDSERGGGGGEGPNIFHGGVAGQLIGILLRGLSVGVEGV